MKTTNPFLPTILILTLAFSISCQPADPVELRLNLDKGEKYVQTVTTEQSIKQDLPGGAAQEQNNKTTITYTIECTEVDETGTTVKLTYDSIKMQKDGSRGSSSYDSDKDKDPTDPEALAYAKMIGHGFSVKLSPKSEVVDMMGIEEFLDRVYSSLNLPDNAMGNQIRQMLKKQFGPSTMKHMLERSYIPFPEKAVGEGDSWSKSFDLGGIGFPLKVDNKYTVKDLGSSRATLEAEGQISSIEGQTMKILTMEFAYDLQGQQTGEQVVDVERGILIESNVTQKMKGDMTILNAPGMGADEKGMKVPMEMETRIVLTTD